MENQFGFRANRSTTDAIFIIREAIKTTKKSLYFCMIDLKAAYDHIDRKQLFRVLEIRTKAPKIIALLKSIYTGTIASIKNSKTNFNVHTGCRQGGLESPILFNIYIDFVLRCAEYEVLKKYPNSGLKYSYHIKSESTTREQRRVSKISSSERLRMLLYADDIILLSESLLELDDILTIYDKTFKRFGLTISIEKTKTLTFNVDEEIMQKHSLLSLRNEPIENVRVFKYLGHILSNQPTPSSSFITHQISSAFSKWNQMKHVLLDRRIRLSIRIKFLEAFIRSRLLYSVQAWNLSSVELLKVESIWNCFLRKMIKGGFVRKNVPNNKNNNVDGEINWAYEISNIQLKSLTNQSKYQSK